MNTKSQATANTEESLKLGGWSPYREVTIEDKIVFDEAMGGIIGVNYTPEMVSTQVVSGMNYRFKCIASLPSGEDSWMTLVAIYKPLSGKAIVKEIHRI